MKPHRGGLILALGILSWVCCIICGIAAWVMANNDLREMQSGVMDRSGESLTKAGKIISMVHVYVSIAFIAIYAIILLIALA